MNPGPAPLLPPHARTHPRARPTLVRGTCVASVQPPAPSSLHRHGRHVVLEYSVLLIPPASHHTTHCRSRATRCRAGPRSSSRARSGKSLFKDSAPTGPSIGQWFGRLAECMTDLSALGLHSYPPNLSSTITHTCIQEPVRCTCGPLPPSGPRPGPKAEARAPTTQE